jgi:AraC-like DNA-binding protein
LIEFIWAADGYVASAPRERVLPSGAPALVIHLEERPLLLYPDQHADAPNAMGGDVLCGARTSPLVISTCLGATAGVHFRPGGARPFFDLPADALAEQTVSLETLWGSAARSLREQLMAASTPLARVRILEAALLARVRRSLEPSPALRMSLAAFEECDLASVAEVNRRTGLSPKRLLALFREEIGLSPKTYWRVRRFRAALDQLDQGLTRGATLAHQHGYFDQAHFLREFRALAGSTVSEYLAARVVGTDHVSVYG